MPAPNNNWEADDFYCGMCIFLAQREAERLGNPDIIVLGPTLQEEFERRGIHYLASSDRFESLMESLLAGKIAILE